MFLVSDADAAAIQAAFHREGELSAAIELRRRFPGITDNARARECARTIAGWTPRAEVPVAVPKRGRPREPLSPLVSAERDWQVTELHREGLKHRVIAERLGLTPSIVGNIITRLQGTGTLSRRLRDYRSRDASGLDRGAIPSRCVDRGGRL